MTTPDTLPDGTVVDARLAAVNAWTRFTQDRNLSARVPDWRTGAAPDGSPALTAEVAGPGAAHALHLFASQYGHLVLRYPGDQRPQYDYSAPGRVACVWRSDGVWVELWHPDTVADLPEPARIPSTARALLSRASGRLTYTRRPKTPKETTV